MSLPPVQRLAVCSWSLQPAGPDALIGFLETIGIKRVQIALDPIRENPTVWGDCAEKCAAAGVTFVSGMFGTIGEDYTTMDTIRVTGGLVPDATWGENWRNAQKNVRLAEKLDLDLVTFHAGFLPHDESDPGYRKLSDRIGQVADLFAEYGIGLGFETGQEDAPSLRKFLLALNRPNVSVNFDPANMILYEKGNPIEALRTLGPWIRQCHLKDARKTAVTGKWGAEVPVGTGEVDWKAFFSVLGEIQFAGNLCIEREAGTQRVVDIKTAKEYVESLR